ncbi:Flp pilus assembly protein CpaB [Methylosinus sporium]|uniref:Flp pilus assembly protein CpaB n=1 Tax=Methylosinus sporium TaxID=428 RepID=A0A549SW18_METSR|nr:MULTISPECIES: Flp pilus assembly protein CpaB [Methylosinus]MBU3890798.1 Flp pilus assembly protein CpaB [Methylosinus sp. KRF6]TRL33767.1 Flp pilus assembly protein CpaB [Methylosinus sporium]
MNKAQIVVLGVAVAAGGGAFLMMSGSAPEAPKIVQMIPTQPQTDNVLVATRDLSYGTALAEPDTNWIEWPIGAVPQGVLRKSEAPNAKEELRGSYVRNPISNGEPVRRERLVKGPTAGLMSTLLPAGHRAVAIDISPNTTAGGFILPNDHVDVMRTFRDADRGREGAADLSSEIILTNVRVMAIGPIVETKNGESVVTGATATLDLEPRQAELVILAQRTGQLALMLRSMADAHDDDKQASAADDSLTVVRFGVPTTMRTR